MRWDSGAPPCAGWAASTEVIPEGPRVAYIYVAQGPPTGKLEVAGPEQLSLQGSGTFSLSLWTHPAALQACFPLHPSATLTDPSGDISATASVTLDVCIANRQLQRTLHSPPGGPSPWTWDTGGTGGGVPVGRMMGLQGAGG